MRDGHGANFGDREERGLCVANKLMIFLLSSCRTHLMTRQFNCEILNSSLVFFRQGAPVRADQQKARGERGRGSPAEVSAGFGVRPSSDASRQEEEEEAGGDQASAGAPGTDRRAQEKAESLSKPNSQDGIKEVILISAAAIFHR